MCIYIVIYTAFKTLGNNHFRDQSKTFRFHGCKKLPSSFKLLGYQGLTGMGIVYKPILINSRLVRLQVLRKPEAFEREREISSALKGYTVRKQLTQIEISMNICSWGGVKVTYR